MSRRRVSRHWHIGIAVQGGRENYASVEHEHFVNRGRPHTHGDEKVGIVMSPGLNREPLPEQLRDGFVLPPK